MPEPTKLPIDEGLKLFLPVAGKLANGFRRKYPGLCRRTTGEEVYSTCLALFVFLYPKYDPGKSEFVTYFRRAAWRGLLDVYGAEAVKDRRLPIAPLVSEPAAPKPVLPFSPWRFAASVPKKHRRDVRRVLAELFGGDFLSLPSPVRCRTELALHLRKVLGWSRGRTRLTFSMIQEALRAE